MLRRCAPLLAAAAARAAPVPNSGPYKVSTASITLSSPSGTTVVVYPTKAADQADDNATAETFPFLSYAHGGAAGGALTLPYYSASMETIASYGIIVVATQANMEGGDPTFSHQQIAVIKSCKKDPSLHKSFARADFTRVGVAGHSMGGIATSRTLAEGAADLHLKAGWAQHPCGVPGAKSNKHPTMFTTGTAEPGPMSIGCPAPISDSGFKDSVNAKPRILFNIQGANHLEPMSGALKGPNRELIPGSLFLSCHLRDDQDACAKVYGKSGKGVCDLQLGPSKYTLHECKVEGGTPTPPGPPAPPRYHCDAATGTCAEAASGHSTIAKCQAACAPPTPPTPPSPPAAQHYACVVQSGAKACSAVPPGVPGSYPTLAACQQDCK